MSAESGAIDSKAFEILIRLHHRRMRAFALSLVQDTSEVDDLVQDAFVTAYQNLARFDTKRDFGAWLRGIIRMKYLERARTRRLTTLDDEILEALEVTHRQWDLAVEDGRQEALEALRQCLTKLGIASRRSVELFYHEHLSCAQVAEYLGTNEVVVKKRLQRAREDLAQCIKYRLQMPQTGAL